jgi:hypothetical protein
MEYIYLIREKEFVDKNIPIYKIGKIKQVRHSEGGEELILCVIVDNPHTVETELLIELNNRFIHKSEYGNGYFEGILSEIKETILLYCIDGNVKKHLDKKTENEGIILDEGLKKLESQITNLMKSTRGILQRIENNYDKIKSKQAPPAKLLNTVNDKKLNIINLFNTNVKGKRISIDGTKHDGSEGYWLETQMNIKHNNKNEPDINGFEMKKDSAKISFGDFSASEYLFSKKKNTINKQNKWDSDKVSISRIDFIKYFGSPNPLKNNRYSWSGKCVPTYGCWNNHGQTMIFDNDDLCIYYSFEKDNREAISRRTSCDFVQTEKESPKIELPSFLKEQNKILIAIWEKEKLQQHINKKFNVNGFFICKKISNTYEKICFGKPFDFEHFVTSLKNKSIIFDSGMYVGNSRNYSQFRSSGTKFWNSLIYEEV